MQNGRNIEDGRSIISTLVLQTLTQRITKYGHITYRNWSIFPCHSIVSRWKSSKK